LGKTGKWLVLILVGILISCSIEKRVHTGGYYIKWHKHYKGSKDPEQVEKESDTSSTVLLEDTSSVPDKAEELEPQIDSVPDVSDKQEKVKPDHLPRADRKFEPLGVLSFKFLIGSVLTAFLSDTTSTHEQYVITSSLFIVLIGMAFILGIISMVRYLRHPRQYKFNIWALLSILAGGFVIVMWIFGNMALF
jgi:hypothetical protein